MIYQLLVIAVFATIVAHGIPTEIDEKELEAVRERLAKNEMIEEMMKSMLDAEERVCLPLGAECNFWRSITSPFQECCGAKTRCANYGKKVKGEDGEEKWISICEQWLA